MNEYLQGNFLRWTPWLPKQSTSSNFPKCSAMMAVLDAVMNSRESPYICVQYAPQVKSTSSRVESASQGFRKRGCPRMFNGEKLTTRSSSCYDMKVNRWVFTSTSLIMSDETSTHVAEWLFDGGLGDGF